jgi:hypothetical protein
VSGLARSNSPAETLPAQEYPLWLKQFPSTSRKLARQLPFKSSTRLVPRRSCAYEALFRGALLALRFRLEKYATACFLVPPATLRVAMRAVESGELDELQNITRQPTSSHCFSVQERLVNYGSDARYGLTPGLDHRKSTTGNRFAETLRIEPAACPGVGAGTFTFPFTL